MQDQSFFEKLNNWIRNSITVKLVSIGILILILLIPNSLIQDLIHEREYTMQNAVSEVSSKWGNAKTIIGPVLTIQYLSYQKTNDGKLVTVTEYAHFLPEQLQVNGTVKPEIRKRGIYEVAVYNTEFSLSGKFSNPDLKSINLTSENMIWKDAYLSLGISDMRGIKNKMEVNWNGTIYPFNPGMESKDVIASGVSTRIPAQITDSAGFKFNISLTLNGSKNLYFTPVGKETNVKLKSDWKTPSFTGAFLPDQRTVDKNGFSASWNILHLNRNYPQAWHGPAYSTDDSTFGVELLVPVDEYQKAYRSAKYSVLIICLSFLIFFFNEVMNRKRIHPIQYLLVGLALCMFYTLLLSLSEHMGFNLAYLIAAIATVAIITIYTLGVFGNRKFSLILSGLLVLIYGFVFTILQLEDFALLMGSLGLFLILALVMYLSRKIDWYNVNK